MGWFDGTGFYDALDSQRRARNLNWKQVAAESGVSASTLTRMAQGKRPDVDGLAALASWSGLNADDFIRSDGERRDPEPLAKITTYLRSDKNLTPEAATALDQVIKATYERLTASE
jgi:transcriptional regulator with XRE-family HTH domain